MRTTISSILLALLGGLILFGLGYIPLKLYKGVENPVKRVIIITLSAITGLCVIISAFLGLILSLVLSPILILKIL